MPRVLSCEGTPGVSAYGNSNGLFQVDGGGKVATARSPAGIVWFIWNGIAAAVTWLGPVKFTLFVVQLGTVALASMVTVEELGSKGLKPFSVGTAFCSSSPVIECSGSGSTFGVVEIVFRRGSVDSEIKRGGSGTDEALEGGKGLFPPSFFGFRESVFSEEECGVSSRGALEPAFSSSFPSNCGSEKVGLECCWRGVLIEGDQSNPIRLCAIWEPETELSHTHTHKRTEEK